MNMNQVFIGGRLCRDVELKYTPQNTAIGTLAIAVNRTWKDAQGVKQEEATFIECKAWGKTAETISQYFRKGQEIFLIGRLTTDSWEDRETGKKRYKTYVTVERFEFCGKSEQATDETPAQQPPASRPAPARTAPPPPPDDSEGPHIPF